MNVAELNSKIAIRWQETRKNGLATFILRYAVLKFGVLFGAFCYLINFLTQQSKSYWGDFFLFCVLVFVLGGAILGLGFWYFMEKNYKKYLTR